VNGYSATSTFDVEVLRNSKEPRSNCGLVSCLIHKAVNLINRKRFHSESDNAIVRTENACWPYTSDVYYGFRLRACLPTGVKCSRH